MKAPEFSDLCLLIKRWFLLNSSSGGVRGPLCQTITLQRSSGLEWASGLRKTGGVTRE